jgi:hypothetical protein
MCNLDVKEDSLMLEENKKASDTDNRDDACNENNEKENNDDYNEPMENNEINGHDANDTNANDPEDANGANEGNDSEGDKKDNDADDNLSPTVDKNSESEEDKELERNRSTSNLNTFMDEVGSDISNHFEVSRVDTDSSVLNLMIQDVSRPIIARSPGVVDEFVINSESNYSAGQRVVEPDYGARARNVEADTGFPSFTRLDLRQLIDRNVLAAMSKDMDSPEVERCKLLLKGRVPLRADNRNTVVQQRQCSNRVGSRGRQNQLVGHDSLWPRGAAIDLNHLNSNSDRIDSLIIEQPITINTNSGEDIDLASQAQIIYKVDGSSSEIPVITEVKNRGNVSRNVGRSNSRKQQKKKRRVGSKGNSNLDQKRLNSNIYNYSRSKGVEVTVKPLSCKKYMEDLELNSDNFGVGPTNLPRRRRRRSSKRPGRILPAKDYPNRQG